MFRAKSENAFQGPHQNLQIIDGGADPAKAKAAMIMIHGRGATAESILTLADEFNDGKLHTVAPQANQYQWYPYSFLAPTDQNEPGLSSGLQVVYDLVSDLESKGFKKGKIVLLGFSQGACLASEFLARHPAKYGGLIALSGGLIGDKVSSANYEGSLDDTPVFLGCSNIDPHIPKERVDETESVFNSLNGKVMKKIYPGMGHTVNDDEIEEIKKILHKVYQT